MVPLWKKSSKDSDPVHIPAPIPFVPDELDVSDSKSPKKPRSAARPQAADQASQKSKEIASQQPAPKKSPAKKKAIKRPKPPQQKAPAKKAKTPEPRDTMLRKRGNPPKMRFDEGVSTPTEDPRVFEDVDPAALGPSIMSDFTPPPLERLLSEEQETSRGDVEWGIEKQEEESAQGIYQSPIEAPPAEDSPKPAKTVAAVPLEAEDPLLASSEEEIEAPPVAEESPVLLQEDFDAVEAERQRRAAARKSRAKGSKNKKKKAALPKLSIQEYRQTAARKRALRRAQKRRRDQERMEKMLRAAKAGALGEEVEEEKKKTKVFPWQKSKASSKTEEKKFPTVPSLDIGSSVLRLYDPGSGQFFQRAIPDGIIIDGILAEPDEFVEEIKALWKESGASKKMRFSVKNRLLQVRAVHFPATVEGEVERALEVNAKAIVAPMKPEETVIDYYELSRSGKALPLIVVAADKAMVESYSEALKDAGLKPIGCSAAPLSSQRALRIPRSPSQTHVLVDIGAETTSFLVASGPDTYFMRILDIGGNDFTRALMQDGNTGWGLAEKEKRDGGLFIENKSKRKALRSVADQLSQEILSTKDLFDSSDLGIARPISGITFLGGGSLLSGLPEQIQYILSISETSSPVGREEGYNPRLFAGAKGVAGESNISLLPHKKSSLFSRSTKKKGGSQLDPALGMLLLGAVLSLFVAYLAVGNSKKTAMLKDEVKLSKRIAGQSEWPKIFDWLGDHPGARVYVSSGAAKLDFEISGPAEGEELDDSLLKAGITIRSSDTVKDITRGSWVWTAEVGEG